MLDKVLTTPLLLDLFQVTQKHNKNFIPFQYYSYSISQREKLIYFSLTFTFFLKKCLLGKPSKFIFNALTDKV